MILFFSNNRDSRNYFEKISACLTVVSEVYVDKMFILPGISAFLSPPVELIARSIKYKDIENRALNGKPLSAISRLILGVQARWFFAIDTSLINSKKPEMVVVWNGLMFRRSMFVAAAQALNIKICYMENGLLPKTTVCDLKGINANNSVPRTADFYLARPEKVFDDKVELVVREARKPKKTSGKKLPDKYLFIPFQVDTDSQIIIYSSWIKNMKQLFDEVLSVVGQGEQKLAFKEHPSSKIDYAYLHDELDESIGIFANEYSTQELIEKADAVITINSTVGIEAILLGKKVIVLGEAFFNIPGLVLSARNISDLKKRIHELNTFNPDEKLRKNFIEYLKNDYLIGGSWKEATDEHCADVSMRLMEYHNG